MLQNQYMSLAQAAAYCQVNPQTVRRHIMARILVGEKIGNYWVLPIAELNQWNADRLAGKFDKRNAEIEAL